MRTRLSRGVLALLGAFLLIGALIIHFVVVPGLMKLPEDLDESAVFAGVLQSPDPAAPGKMIELPVELEKTIKVDSVDGDTALVTSGSNLYAVPRKSDETPLSQATTRFAIDRTDFGQAPTSDEGVTNQLGGSTFALPPNPAEDGQTLYDSMLQRAVPLEYISTGEIQGRTVLTFRAEESGPLADPTTAARLQRALGQKFGTDGTTVPTPLLAAMGVPADELAGLGDTLPVSLVVSTNFEVNADQEFGSMVMVDQGAAFTAVIGDSASPVTALPIQVLTTKMTDASLTDSIDSLNSSTQKLSIITWWIPGAMVLIGAILLALAFLRRRTTPGPAAPVTTGMSDVKQSAKP